MQQLASETSVVIRLCSVDGEASKAFPAVLTLRSGDRLHRAQWVATELFLTFPPPELASISVVPLTSDETAGRFRVWVFADPSPTLVWDRKVEGGFPELKVLVERILPARPDQLNSRSRLNRNNE